MLGFAFLLLLLPHIGRRALWEPDEARYSEIPREMLASGDFVTPRLNGIKYFEKPPLFYWLEAGAQRIFGPHEFALRLPLVVLSLLSLIVVYLVGRDLFGRRAALLACAVLGTSPLYAGLSQVVSLDLPVSALLTIALLGFLNATRKPPGWERRLWLWLFFAGAAGATMTKGLIGMVLPGIVILAWIVLTRRWSALALAFAPSGILLFLALTLPWHVLAAQANPEFLRFYFVHEHFERYLTRSHHRYEPAWFFLPVLLGGMLPWSVLLPRTGAALWRELRSRARSGDAPVLLFLLLWAALIFLFFSASSSKLIPYILPVVPPLALLLGRDLARLWEDWAPNGGAGAAEGRVRLPLGAALGLLLFTVPVGIAVLLPHPLGGSKVLFYSEILGPYRYFLGISVLLVGLLPFFLLRARRPRLAVGAWIGTAALFYTALFAPLPLLDSHRSNREVAEILRPLLQSGDEVVTVREYIQGLPYYLGRRITVADYLGELEFGVKAEPRTREWMIDGAELARRWAGPGRVYLVVDVRYPKRLLFVSGLRGRMVAKAEHYTIRVNR